MDPITQEIQQKVQGATQLQLAFIGVSNGLFDELNKQGELDCAQLASACQVDEAYLRRWLEAAFAFELLDANADKYRLTELAKRFVSGQAGSLMGMAAGSVLSAHMAERAAGLMRSGERPGEKVLGERETILPLFGPMLESMFSTMLGNQILPDFDLYKQINEQGGTVVDLGCGNGWYIRTICKKYPNIKGIGLDGFDENIRQAQQAARKDGVEDRVTFMVGDIYQFNHAEPVDAIAMNRALHHVWDQYEKVFSTIANHLKPGGAAVIWEPNWPANRDDLRHPKRKMMAFQNLSEHVQGNHFLQAEEIKSAFAKAGMDAEIHLFMEGNEAVVVGRKK